MDTSTLTVRYWEGLRPSSQDSALDKLLKLYEAQIHRHNDNTEPCFLNLYDVTLKFKTNNEGLISEPLSYHGFCKLLIAKVLDDREITELKHRENCDLRLNKENFNDKTSVPEEIGLYDGIIVFEGKKIQFRYWIMPVD